MRGRVGISPFFCVSGWPSPADGNNLVLRQTFIANDHSNLASSMRLNIAQNLCWALRGGRGTATGFSYRARNAATRARARSFSENRRARAR